MAIKYARIKSTQIDYDISRGISFIDEFVKLKDEEEARTLLARSPQANVIRYERVKLELVSD